METYWKMQLSLFWSSGIVFIYPNVCSSCKLLDINVFISKLQNTGQKKKKKNLRKLYSLAVYSTPKKLTTRLSIKVEGKLYISQNIT